MKIYQFIIVGMLIFAWSFYLLIKKISHRSNDQSTWIIGGVNATDGEFPFIATLKDFDFESDEGCGASIISPKWLLTASHCLNRQTIEYYKENFYFLVGTINFMVGGTGHNISNIIFNPDGYDVALVELKNQIEFNNRTRSIELAHNRAPDNSTVTAIGWGRINNNVTHPTILQKVELHTISIDKCCEFKVGSVYCDEIYYEYYQTTVCTLDHIGKDTCNGDSGGPLIYNNTQIGVVIGGPTICGIGEPAIFASVPFFRNWINRVTGIV